MCFHTLINVGKSDATSALRNAGVCPNTPTVISVLTSNRWQIDVSHQGQLHDRVTSE